MSHELFLIPAAPEKSGIYLMNVRVIFFFLSSTDLIIIIMRKVTGKHLLCFFLIAFTLAWAEDTKQDVRKIENDTGEDSTFFNVYINAFKLILFAFFCCAMCLIKRRLNGGLHRELKLCSLYLHGPM